MSGIKMYQKKVLLAANISYILVILDTSVVNVALPTIKASLDLGVSSLQWVVNAYLLLFASLLLSGGALCDRFGAKPVYMTGLTLFTLASVLCGLSPDVSMLLSGRVLQGVSAAILVPGSLALITHTYTDKTERARAIASWASWGGIALVLGPIVGGWLTEYFSWRSIFLINVPLCLAGIGLAALIPQMDKSHEKSALDIKGQALLFITLFCFLSGVIRLTDPAASDNSAALLLLSSGALLLLFLWVEKRSAAPLVPLSLFRQPNFSAISWIFFAGAFSFFGSLFILTFWFQDIQHYSALQTGMFLLPLSVSVIIGNKASGWLSNSYKLNHIMLTGALLRLLGFGGLLLTQYTMDYLYIILPLILIGFGGGLGSPMSTSLFMQSVPRQYTGVASGISRATGQLGSAFAVAVFGQIISNEQMFVPHMKYAVVSIVAVTLSIVVINVFGIKNDVDEYHSSLSGRTGK